MKIFWKIIAIIAIPALIFVIGKYILIQIEENKQYTIGKIFRKSWSGGAILDYEYTVEGERHIGGYGGDKDYDLLMNKRFFLKFSSENPGTSIMLINMPVPDSVWEAPPDGWSPEEFEELFGEEIPN